ncbi:putative phospholipase B-like 2 [Marmota monax]|uniref:Phospholipase B-like n=1 Tax=Marmota monax TaxID=9995 RepID=A0A834UN49_MARMO|nr:putative phospholipase B-like 2 [Marmota monax]KAF7464324.1 putative phospholipase B 2-like [Marmota monax]KAI6049716.1 PLBD2 [Marmota monax]KAI6059945.1 PLBD2 [Marmota monax]
MVAPMYGSPGGRLARALTRALALALVLALLVGLFLSGLAGAIPAPGDRWKRHRPAPPASRSRSVLLDAASGQLRLVDGRHPEAVAWANLTNAIHETGWAFLELGTSGSYNDSLQAYAAGVVEASVSEELIYMHWMNTVVNYCGPFEYEVGYCEKLKHFLEANLEWMQREMQWDQDSGYWHQVRLTLLQLKGLEDSYEGRVSFPTGKFTIKPLGFLLLQISGDLEDLEPALNKTRTRAVLGSGSCSALIKLLPGQRDLLVAHNTWNSYQHMLRIIKKYTFQFREGPQEDALLVPGNQMVFSSYPGTIFSCDDFYILGSQLVALETTIGNRNAALWKYVQPEGCVLEWIRNLVANRLALDGAIWTDVFKRFNSGTYNNQWMIVDYKAFVPGQTSPGGRVLTVLEQLPGLVVVADKTSDLYDMTYWASYNIPAFETVFNASGLQALVAQYGNWFSYDKNPRAQIFQRNQSLVRDMDSMIRLMRYNNFLHDPLSLCEACSPRPNGENAISARSDLNPANGSYPFQALHQRLHGGIDVKVTNMSLVKALGLLAASGPTWDQVPPFQWSTSPFSDKLHMGHPDLWKFPPLKVSWG